MTAAIKNSKCAKCGVAGGEQCITVDGRPALKVHYGRVDRTDYFALRDEMLAMPEERRRPIIARRAREGRWLISGQRVG